MPELDPYVFAYVAGHVVAVDCEMVGVMKLQGAGKATGGDALCRVSVVGWGWHNDYGSPKWERTVLLDTLVNIDHKVVDFRSHITGIDEQTFRAANKMSFEEARRRVQALIANKIVVGHATWNDFRALGLAHPPNMVRDTAVYEQLRPPWKRESLPSLKLLAQYWFREEFQSGVHDSVMDACMSLRLYCMHRKDWEESIVRRATCEAAMKNSLLFSYYALLLAPASSTTEPEAVTIAQPTAEKSQAASDAGMSDSTCEYVSEQSRRGVSDGELEGSPSDSPDMPYTVQQGHWSKSRMDGVGKFLGVDGRLYEDGLDEGLDEADNATVFSVADKLLYAAQCSMQQETTAVQDCHDEADSATVLSAVDKLSLRPEIAAVKDCSDEADTATVSAPSDKISLRPEIEADKDHPSERDKSSIIQGLRWQGLRWHRPAIFASPWGRLCNHGGARGLARHSVGDDFEQKETPP